MIQNQNKQEVLAQLRKLNFEELIHIDTDDAANYTYESYALSKGHKIKESGTGGCNKCELNNCLVDTSNKLRFISHGAHTFDLLSIHHIDYSDWSDKPILFILESPGGDGKFYADEKKYSKRPTEQWYWVHSGIPDLDLERNTKRKKYGEFFATIINHFKLSNVYVTNLVKCGLERNKEPEYNIEKYSPNVVKKCYEEYLDNEVGIFNPQAVFAFGGRVYNAFRKRFGDKYPENKKLFCMPHPSPRILSEKIYKEKALGHFLIGLHNSGIITETEKVNYSQEFKQLGLL